MDFIAASKKNHLWRKTVWHTDPDQHPLTGMHSVEVYCCEEANGFGVWYVRKLGLQDEGGLPTVSNGDYLLRYFAQDRRDDAIEWAVLVANSGIDGQASIASLDAAVTAGQRI